MMVECGETDGVASELGGASPRFKHAKTPNAMTVALLKDAASRAAYVRSEIAALKAAQRAFPPPLVSPGPDSPANGSPAPALQGPKTSRTVAQAQLSPGPAAKLNRSHDSVIPHQKNKPLQQSPLQAEVNVSVGSPADEQWRKVATARHRDPPRPTQSSLSARPASHRQQHPQQQQHRSSAPSFSAAASPPPPLHTRSQVKAQVLERMKNVNAAMSKISKKKSRSKSARGPRSNESPPGWASLREAERTREEDEGDLRGLDGAEATLRGGFLGSPPPSLNHSLQHEGRSSPHRDAHVFSPQRRSPFPAVPEEEEEEEHHFRHRQPQGGSGGRGRGPPPPSPLSPPRQAASPPLQGSPGGGAQVPQTFVSVSSLLNSSLEDAAAAADQQHPHSAAGKTKRKKKKHSGAAGAAASGPYEHQQQHQQPKPRKPASARGTGGSKGSSSAVARGAQPPQQGRRPAASHPIVRHSHRATPTKKRPNGSKGRSRKGPAGDRSSPSESGLSPWQTAESDSGGKLDVDPVNHLLRTVDRKILLEGAEGRRDEAEEERRRRAPSPDDPFYTWDPEELAMELGRDAMPARGPTAAVCTAGPKAAAGWRQKARASVVDAGPSESCSSPGEDSVGSSAPGTPAGTASTFAAAKSSKDHQVDGHTAPYALDEEYEGNTISSVAAGTSPGGSDAVSDAAVGSVTPAPSMNSDPDPFMVSPGSLPMAFRNLPHDHRAAGHPSEAGAASSLSPSSKLPVLLDDEAHEGAMDDEEAIEVDTDDMDSEYGSPMRPRTLGLPGDSSSAAAAASQSHRQPRGAASTVSSILGDSRASLSTLSVDDVLREVAKGTRMGKRKELGAGAPPAAPKSSPSLARRLSSNFSAKGSSGSFAGGSTRYLQLVLDRRSALLAYRRGPLMGTNHGYVMSVDARGGAWEPSSEISVKTDSFLFHLVPSSARDYCVWIMGLNVALHYVDGADPDLSSAAVDAPLHSRLRTAMPIDSLSQWASSGKN